MKYSVRGELVGTDGSDVIATINKYVLWRLVTSGGEAFIFEAWVNAEADKSALFDDLKPLVDAHGGHIDWHLCSHDEDVSTPCEITETYGSG